MQFIGSIGFDTFIFWISMVEWRHDGYAAARPLLVT